LVSNRTTSWIAWDSVPDGVSYLSYLQIRYGASGVHPPSYAMGTGLERKVDHPLDVKNEWKYTSTPHLRLRGVDREIFFIS